MFLDREQPIAKSFSGDLPHWHQDETMQFVTFRLADSLPQSVIAGHRSEIGRFEEHYLHQGYGSSLFRYAQYRKVLGDSLMRYDSEIYSVFAYVIMPNHVHVLIQPYGDERVNDIIGRIKQFTSNEINRMRDTRGALWQRESFDRLVRSEDEYLRYVEYIRENPRNLQDGEFEVYVKSFD